MSDRHLSQELLNTFLMVSNMYDNINDNGNLLPLNFSIVINLFMRVTNAITKINFKYLICLNNKNKNDELKEISTTRFARPPEGGRAIEIGHLISPHAGRTLLKGRLLVRGDV